MKLTSRIPATLLFAALACSSACSDEDSTAPKLPADVQSLRNVLEPYTSLSKAKADGYATAITDCMSNGDEGAMGVHWGNPSLIDANTESLRPEALIYEPGANGEMSLVGVEFIVPFAVHPKTAAPPTLFGQQFKVNDVFGVWAMHVWTHRSNPSGLFASWNPRVHC